MGRLPTAAAGGWAPFSSYRTKVPAGHLARYTAFSGLTMGENPMPESFLVRMEASTVRRIPQRTLDVFRVMDVGRSSTSDLLQELAQQHSAHGKKPCFIALRAGVMAVIRGALTSFST